MIKLCECGCGQPTKMITHTHNKAGRIKGEYSRFISGHSFKILLGEKHSQWKGGNIKRICEYCNKEFYVNHYRIKMGWGKFCSISCSLKSRTGENNFCWKGGITPLYKAIRNLPENKEWRSDIFQRDNYTCQICGRRRKSGDRVIIHPHHIKEFAIILAEFLKEYDQFSPFEDQHTLLRLAMKYKPFWDINNGETQCKECHIELHKKEKIKT